MKLLRTVDDEGEVLVLKTSITRKRFESEAARLMRRLSNVPSVVLSH